MTECCLTEWCMTEWCVAIRLTKRQSDNEGTEPPLAQLLQVLIKIAILNKGTEPPPA